MVVIPQADSVDPVKGNCSVSDLDLLPEKVKILDVEVGFRKRGRVAIELRRMARHDLQVVDTNQELQEKNTKS
jgi:hypothetical protein